MVFHLILLCRCLQKVTKRQREIATHSAYSRERELYDEFLACLTYSVWNISGSIDKLKNVNSREIRGLNIKSILIDVVAFAAKTGFCYLGSERLPAHSTICLFGCLVCVWAFVCLVLVCLNIFFFQLLLSVQGASVSFLNAY